MMDFDEEHWLWLYLQNYQNLNFDTIINRGLILGCKFWIFRTEDQKTYMGKPLKHCLADKNKPIFQQN